MGKIDLDLNSVSAEELERRHCVEMQRDNLPCAITFRTPSSRDIRFLRRHGRLETMPFRTTAYRFLARAGFKDTSNAPTQKNANTYRVIIIHSIVDYQTVGVLLLRLDLRRSVEEEE